MNVWGQKINMVYKSSVTFLSYQGNDGLPAIAIPSVETTGFRRPIMQQAKLYDISNLASLEENWDGYSAAPISHDVIKNAKLALQKRLLDVSFFELTPNPHGTVSFLWETDHGKAHLEIGKTTYSFYIDRHFDEPYFSKGSISEIPQEIASLIKDSLNPTSVASSPVTSVDYGQPVSL